MEESPEKKSVKSDIALYAALEGVAKSEGGKILVKGLKQDLVQSINELIMMAKTGTEIELRATVIKLGERLALFKTLTLSTKNRQLAIRELNRILEDDPDDVQDDT